MEPARQRYTFEQYVELERLSPIKHEFLEGHVWAMVGGTPDDAAIAANLVTLLSNQLRGRPCRVFTSDLRIRVASSGLATYPDVSVVCDALQYDPTDASETTVVNPRVVIEVLSPSTEGYDRGEKLEHYQTIESLQEILLVATDAQRVEHWQRDGATWTERGATAEATVRLASLGVDLPLAEVNRDPLAAD